MKRGLEEKAMTNIVCAQKKQKIDYDRKHTTPSKFFVGQKVLLRNLKKENRKGGKMTFSWLGPYEILDILSNSTCLLRNIKGNNRIKKKYSLHHVKPFVEEKSNSKLHSLTSECNNQDKSQRNSKLMKHPTKEVLQKIAEEQGLKIFIMPDLFGGEENDVPSKIHVCKGDGNCFFRAISFLLTGSVCQHTHVRDVVVKHMVSKPCSNLLSGYLGNDVENYITKSGMATDSVWTTDVEILGTANLI
nr:uncharacterized protein LOC124810314 [Hydra vulgaris]